MKAKLYPNETTIGSFKCTKKRCEVGENVNITESFTSSVTQNTYEINHKLNCDIKVFPWDSEILGWCPAGSVLPHGEKVSL